MTPYFWTNIGNFCDSAEKTPKGRSAHALQ